MLCAEVRNTTIDNQFILVAFRISVTKLNTYTYAYVGYIYLYISICIQVEHHTIHTHTDSHIRLCKTNKKHVMYDDGAGSVVATMIWQW